MQLYDKFKQLAWSKKIEFLQQIFCELILIAVGAFCFFFFTFFIVWTVTLIISPLPYQFTTQPNLHMDPLDGQTLQAIFVNEQLKYEVCRAEDKKVFQYEEVSYEQLCQINYEKMPKMNKYVDVTALNMDYPKIKHLTACIKEKQNRLTCQKFPLSSKVLLFKELNLDKILYLKVKMHLKSSEWPEVPVAIEFYQNCSFITRFIKDYYNLFALILSYGVTACCTLGVIILRIGIVLCKMQEEDGKKQ